MRAPNWYGPSHFGYSAKVLDHHGSVSNLSRRAAAQLLRLVPGSAALRLKRDLRDSAWLREADAVIFSYPKSGRTFVRAMLARIYQRRFGIDERKLLEFPILRKSKAGAPRLLFTHAGDAMRRPSEIRLDRAAFSHSKMVLLARHPGDVAVSRYHHLKHRSRDLGRRRLSRQPLETFVWAEEGGIPSIVTFLNLLASLPQVTIIRYEDLLADTAHELARLATAIGLQFDDSDIADAVDFATFAKLSEKEREGYFSSSRLRPAREGDERSVKVRSGTCGGYRAQLGSESAAHIDHFLDEHLDPRLGYSSPSRG